jgi:bifunctional N-acetylglucosamine-1-phosphate-uridyltransferase/glucosamine-1-phosphate-acetyltransferase GlmU-like protein
MHANYGHNCIIFEDARIGENTRIGNFVFIRDTTVIGKGCVVGSYVDIEGDVHVGDFVSLQSGCYLTRGVIIEDEVFCGPRMITLNDKPISYRRPVVDFHAPCTPAFARRAGWRRQRPLPRRDNRRERLDWCWFSGDARRTRSVHRDGQSRPDRGDGANRRDHLADVY